MLLNFKEFLCQLNVAEKPEVVTTCDPLVDLKFQMRRRLKLHIACASGIVKR